MARFVLTETAKRLKARYGKAVGYSRIYRAVLAGELDARREPGSRFWTLDEEQLPVVAEMFGLIEQPPAPRSRRPRAA